jgi:adenine-specific DNA-methyltransferase
MPNSLEFEGELDSALGQVWTPAETADHMVELLTPYMNSKSKVLDPAAGPGTFTQSLLKSGQKFESITNFEIDNRLNDFLDKGILNKKVSVIRENFLTFDHSNSRYDLAILNPPYIRHELINGEEKEFLITEIKRKNSTKFTRRMNYFGYFLIWTASLLKPKGVMCAIVYDSLNSTQYGKELTEFFSANGHVIHREQISAPFEDTLIDAEIIIWQKAENKDALPLELEFQIQTIQKRSFNKGYCSVQELAMVKRGTSFLKREFFIRDSITSDYDLVGIVTKQSVKQGLIAEANGYAILKSDSYEKNLKVMEQLRSEFPSSKLEELKSLPTAVIGAILFNYYMRDNIRHLINPENIPASDNFYCVTPLDSGAIIVYWVIANSTQGINALVRNSRTQGSGLRKLQLYEYLDSEFPDYRLFSEADFAKIHELGLRAIEDNWPYSELKSASTAILRELGYGDEV